MSSPSNKWEKVHEVENTFETDMIKDVLETHGCAYVQLKGTKTLPMMVFYAPEVMRDILP
jgi:hypothetical protein